MEMTKEQAKEFFSEFFFGDHHIPSDITSFGQGWCVVQMGDLATYDFNHLTRFVVMCHDKCYRGGIVPYSRAGHLKIVIHLRDRNATRMEQRHPTLEDNIAHIRSKYSEEFIK